ncbi:flagellar export chaperone FliS [Caldimonas sp.]|uniref:flagellar export chaperone FliS n=1 Tax=Caldimonas sp. TaxID=2838790 RepID=UPI00391CD373
MFAPFRSQATAYGHVQVETGVAAADPHKLVEMLYDGALDAMARARGALARGDVEAKGAAIGQAVRIIEEGLRSALNKKDGGAVAESLDMLYLYLTTRLTYANLHNDDAALQECVRLLAPVRDAWVTMKSSLKSL